MKKGLIITSIILLIAIGISTYIYFKKSNDRTIILEKIEGETKKIEKVEKEKMEELDRVMEGKQDKIERLNKIEEWNKEITSYLE